MNTKTQAVDFAVISKNMRADYPGKLSNVRNYWKHLFFLHSFGAVKGIHAVHYGALV
jgi:hypothetical protein